VIDIRRRVALVTLANLGLMLIVLVIAPTIGSTPI
jgi:hypothetical protein